LRVIWLDEVSVLIAAVSGRAIAAAARRAGFVPLVADLFGDLDTSVIAAATAIVPGTPAEGLVASALLEALDRLAIGRRIAGLIYGSGFEHRPALLDRLAQRYDLLGNSGATVARLKDPFAFAKLCARLDISHPEVRGDAAPGPDWIIKRRGGAGGGHIRAAREGQLARNREYLQRRVAGEPVSALFLANGTQSLVLGFSRQWADPTARQPFRYGGAARPARVHNAEAMAESISRIVAEVGVVGLNSADFLIRPDGYDLVEINPRPGATLDLYPHPDLLRIHVAACKGRLWEGRLPPEPPTFSGAAAAAVVYAPTAFELAAQFAWPAWTADHQRPGPVRSGAPLCTVIAEAEEAEMAQELVARRKLEVLTLAGAVQ
jgi:predicted ATP-grasp superfamily ATP-dependent carboligase